MNKISEILLVDDSLGDAELTIEALSRGPLRVNVNIVTDGEKALDYLHKRDKYKQSPRPDLILLDFNLPNLSGMEVLSMIKSDSVFKRIPVVILSGSDNEDDIQKSVDLGAENFFIKPLEVNNLIGIIKR